MSRAGTRRRLATVLFLDIVGSTQIAAQLGDRRWRELLNQFRGVVRAELKRHGGHEEDTTGDGFFATFTEPAPAVRASVAMIEGLQALGLDIRCGLHFGECELIEGQLGGIAVHIGSRIMSLAGAGDVVVTSTVRDLVAGADIEFADAGTHALKGVPGNWQAWRVRTLDGSSLPAPLDEEVAAARREGHEPAARDRRRREWFLGGAAAVSVATLAIVLGLLNANATSQVANLVKIDPTSNAIALQIRDQYRSDFPHALWAVNGALWQGATEGFGGLVRRDIESGDVLETIEIDEMPSAAAFGFGSIWLAGMGEASSIERLDAVSGRTQSSLSIDDFIVSMDDGPDAMWLLSEDGALIEVDPIANEVVGRHDSGTSRPGVVVVLGDRLWVCDCENHRIVEFDPEQDEVLRTLTFPQSGFLVGLTDTAGGVTLWLLDIQGATLTPVDEDTGEAGQPIGIGANLHDAAVSFGSVWVAAGDRVLRLEPGGPTVIATIRMPEGMSAGSIAADPETGSLWVGDCGCPIE